MMRHKMMRHMMRHHRMHCLNKQEKMCIATIIGCTFMRGICVGMYLSHK